ncbi:MULTISPECIES: hypothetical protein [unclassified Bacillus (in: firmicutes)]|uniref:hypothetical protein n=1 Tax=unclassified Bacillus (in: firmicutes) TaxID=185979 RepID=UPI0008DF5063|nr:MULTISPECIES: hypothetical protein [unclassified Bacillus (in: firmicutes)]SFJ09227.1 hypothetical protein SAMN04488574_106134 [Bacillus sp. 71mf]SFS67250.1 hypothetical protein SAMN04488145_102325 [Bacillus sp. 103mf]
MKVDWFRVDAEFTDVTLAKQIVSQLNQKILITAALRDHIRGNAYDFYNKYGILIHNPIPIQGRFNAIYLNLRNGVNL